MPGREAAEQLLVWVVDERGEAAVQPALELQQVSVSGEKQAAGDETVAEVLRRLDVGPGVQRVVGQCDRARGQGAEQVDGLGPVEPAQDC